MYWFALIKIWYPLDAKNEGALNRADIGLLR
jgi:hypothetical protein